MLTNIVDSTDAVGSVGHTLQAVHRSG